MARIDVVRRAVRSVQTDVGSRRGIGVSAFLLALVTAGAMAHVGVRMKGIEVAYDLGRERRINTELEEERRRLNIEIGMLKDPGRVVSIARDKLKMGPPADIVRLAPGQVLGARPEPAAPAKGSKRSGKESTAGERAAAAGTARRRRPAAGAEPAAPSAEPAEATANGPAPESPDPTASSGEGDE